MNTNETLEVLFLRLLEEAPNPRQQESLERIKKAADYLDSQRMRISPSSIERYCVDREWGGPKAQSIRNSKTLTHYVKSRSAGQRLEVSKKSEIKRPVITDETVRAYIQLIEDERDQAIASRRRIEKGLRSLPGISLDELLRAGFGETTAITDSTLAPFKIPKQAKEAICILFDEDALESVGLQLYKDRIRQNVTLNVLLQKQHMVALRSLVSPVEDQTI